MLQRRDADAHFNCEDNYEEEAEPRLAAVKVPTGVEEPAQAEEPKENQVITAEPKNELAPV